MSHCTALGRRLCPLLISLLMLVSPSLTPPAGAQCVVPGGSLGCQCTPWPVFPGTTCPMCKPPSTKPIEFRMYRARFSGHKFAFTRRRPGRAVTEPLPA